MLTADECSDSTTASNDRKLFYPKFLTAAKWSKDLLKESLMKVWIMEKGIVTHQIDNDYLKKEPKNTKERNINQRERLLGKCRFL